MGRFRRLASPESVVDPSRSAATPARRRNVVPEFLASIGVPGGRRESEATRSPSAVRSISAPNAAMPAIVAAVSSARRGRRIRQGP